MTTDKTPAPEELEALARKHGATSYRNRADTQHPAYGFAEDGLRSLLADALAKWGTPAPVGAEPVARLEIESLKAQLHAAKQINAAQFGLLAASIPGSALRASHGQAPATQQAGIPGNFITHRAAWREALETAKLFSTGVDRSYWDHELAAFDRSFDRLWTLMQDAPQPSPTAQAADSVTAPAPPPECETEAEKRAFAFGWFKALESERMKADNKKKDPL